MDVVLISCSGRKRPRGTKGFAGFGLSKIVEPRTWEKLLSCRRDLARRVGVEPGPDLGAPQKNASVEYLPAYQRYDGNLYRSARLGRELAPVGSVTIHIFSALYGLLDARDPARVYNLKMAARLPGLGTIHRFWSNNGLGAAAAEVIRALAPSQVHDMLPEGYGRALAPWPPPDCAHVVRQYKYPNLGMASDWARGRDLATLMATS